jgi:hypothetical protein
LLHNENILWHGDPLPSNSCVNRRQYNTHCWGTILWTRCFPGDETTRNNGSGVFSAVHAETIYRRSSAITRESWDGS